MDGNGRNGRGQQGQHACDLSGVLASHQKDYRNKYGEILVLGLANDRIPRAAYQERTFESERLRRLSREELARRAGKTPGDATGPRREGQARVARRPGKAADTETADQNKRPAAEREGELIPQISKRRARTLILGDGGNGKSEFTRNLAYSLAEKLDPVDPQACVPVRIELRGLSLEEPHRGEAPHEPLVDRLRQESGHLRHGQRGATPFDLLAAGGRLVLILDGLDELPHVSRGLFDRMLDAAVRYGPLHDCAIILVGRSAGVSESVKSLVEQAFQYEPRPLTHLQIERYVRAHCEARSVSGAMQLVQAIRTSAPAVRELLSQPLMLALACYRLERGKVDLPQSPAMLMEDGLRELLERRAEVGSIDDALEALGKLALAVYPTFGDIKHIDASDKIGDDDRLAAIANNSGILEGDRRGDYRFTIKPLAEYLAGRQLACEGDFPAALARRAGDPEWIDVLAFAVGYAVDAAPGPERAKLRPQAVTFLEAMLRDDCPLEACIHTRLLQAVHCVNQVRSVPNALVDRSIERLAEAIRTTHSRPVLQALSNALESLYWHVPGMPALQALAPLATLRVPAVGHALARYLAPSSHLVEGVTELLGVVESTSRAYDIVGWQCQYNVSSAIALARWLVSQDSPRSSDPASCLAQIASKPDVILLLQPRDLAELSMQLLPFLERDRPGTFDGGTADWIGAQQELCNVLVEAGLHVQVSQVYFQELCAGLEHCSDEVLCGPLNAHLRALCNILQGWAGINEVARYLLEKSTGQDSRASIAALRILMSLPQPQSIVIKTICERFQTTTFPSELVLWAPVICGKHLAEREVLDRVVSLLDADADTVKTVLRLLAELRLTAPPVAEVLALLNHEDPRIRYDSACLLLAWGRISEGVRALIGLLDSHQMLDQWEETNERSSYALGDPPTSEVIRLLLEYPDQPGVRAVLHRSSADPSMHIRERARIARFLLGKGDRLEVAVEVCEQMARSGCPLEEAVLASEALADAGMGDAGGSLAIGFQTYRDWLAAENADLEDLEDADVEDPGDADDDAEFPESVLSSLEEALQQTESPPAAAEAPPFRPAWDWRNAHHLAADALAHEFHGAPAAVAASRDEQPDISATCCRLLYSLGRRMEVADEWVAASLQRGSATPQDLALALERAPRRHAVVEWLYGALDDCELALTACDVFARWGLREAALRHLLEAMARPETVSPAVCVALAELGARNEAVQAARAIITRSRRSDARIRAARWLASTDAEAEAVAGLLSIMKDACAESEVRASRLLVIRAATELRELRPELAAEQVARFLDTAPVSENGVEYVERLMPWGIALPRSAYGLLVAWGPPGGARTVLGALSHQRREVDVARAVEWLEAAHGKASPTHVSLEVASTLADAAAPNPEDDLRKALFREVLVQWLWRLQPNCSVAAPVSDDSTVAKQHVHESLKPDPRDLIDLLLDLLRDLSRTSELALRLEAAQGEDDAKRCDDIMRQLKFTAQTCRRLVTEVGGTSENSRRAATCIQLAVFYGTRDKHGCDLPPGAWKNLIAGVRELRRQPSSRFALLNDLVDDDTNPNNAVPPDRCARAFATGLQRFRDKLRMRIRELDAAGARVKDDELDRAIERLNLTQPQRRRRLPTDSQTMARETAAPSATPDDGEFRATSA